ncbi:uncharacterized protein E0L32_001337 [Thyridium curvatum]|uniref:GPI mannosyltransferase 2 n=1 Tax=Thyridium curvatum TaxID=1093900 RepID=A0A507B0S3_9PEZI|nr:uncharacterized protein E0L32_001337 [Thyridium curvatum]TPX10140.1 hypothetical protein E0L32_001337 [Thyridium curvatum]
MLGRWDTHPLTDLTGLFVAWKAFLLAIAAGTSVGPRYDTSGSLLDLGRHGAPALPLLVQRLMSWDAFYFVQTARRGYLFEQEWAFGTGLPILINSIQKGLGFFGLGRDAVDAAVVAVAVANLSHLLAVLALYRLAKVLTRGDRKLAFVAACLHVLSPAGVFLCAPYAESTFALLTFAGYLAFCAGVLSGSCAARAALTVASGALFGLATAFRSNGVLNGVLFAVFALDAAGRLVRKRPSSRSLPALVDLAALGLGGVLVAAGTVAPQYVAYRRFCVQGAASSALGAREWCGHRVPSIYHFVQEYYWDNGFLRYWKTSNIPLFVMAGPTVLVLLRSGVVTLSQPRAAEGGRPPREAQQLLDVLWCMAASQVALAVLAVLNHHVQIVARISSGLPLWYLWLARRVLLEAKAGRPAAANNMVMFMLMYAPIQAALFGAFLPPA